MAVLTTAVMFGRFAAVTDAIWRRHFALLRAHRADYATWARNRRGSPRSSGLPFTSNEVHQLGVCSNLFSHNWRSACEIHLPQDAGQAQHKQYREWFA